MQTTLRMLRCPARLGFLALICLSTALPPTAASAAPDTHGCWATVAGFRVKVIATNNISCPAAVGFARGATNVDVPLQSCRQAGSDALRCPFAFRGYRCANRLTYPDGRGVSTSSFHCMNTSARRIGFTWTGSAFTG